MICPKCGFEQPDSLDCARCGIVFSRYKGAPAGAPSPFSPSPPPSSPPSSLPSWPPPPPAAAANVFAPAAVFAPDVFAGPPPPPPPAAGPLYGGPGEGGAGTLYEGPAAALPPRPGTIYGGSTSTGVTARRPARPIELSAFSILGQTFSIYLRNIIPFVVISVVVVLPVFFALYYFANNLLAKLPSQAGMQLESMIGGLTVVAAAVLSAPFATAALTYGVFQEMRKKEGTILDCLRVGLTSVLSVLGVVIVQGIVIVLAMIACIIAGIVVVMALPKVLGGIVFVGLILVTLAYLFVVFAVAVPAAVEERPGIFGALGRSAHLTAGHRWSVFGVLFVLGLLNQAVGKALEAAYYHQVNREYLTAVAAAQLVLTGLSATAAAVMYYKLRGVDESVNVEDIASVFD